MKTLIITLLLCVQSFALLAQVPNDIEAQLQRDFGKSFAQQKDLLATAASKLADDYAQSPDETTGYWLAYARHLRCSYLWATRQNDKVAGEITQAIKELEQAKTLGPEARLLLGGFYGASISSNRAAAVTLSAKAQKQYRAALKADPNNRRLYYMMARADFYKPKTYGGGQKVEQYLLKSMVLPEKSTTMQPAPTWGGVEAYQLLVQYYQREERYQDALVYCNRGLAAYPNDVQLANLLAKLQ